MMTDSIQSEAKQPIQNKQFWIEQIKLKQASKLSGASYCRQHKLIVSKFRYWEQKLNLTNPKASQLVPVKLNPSEPVSRPMNTKCTLTFKGGHELKVYDQSVLPMLISLLK